MAFTAGYSFKELTTAFTKKLINPNLTLCFFKNSSPIFFLKSITALISHS